jgi:hypothetical protein
MAKLRERRCSQRNLRKRRQTLVDEPHEPPQRRSLEARRIGLGEELTEQESVKERKPAHLPRGHLGSEDVTPMDGPFEPRVRCALAGHRFDRWGYGWTEVKGLPRTWRGERFPT